MKVVEIAKLMDKLCDVVSAIEDAVKQKSKYYAFVKTQLRGQVLEPDNIEYLIFCKMCEMYNDLIAEDPPFDNVKILNAIDFIDRYIEKMYGETLVLTDGIGD